MICYIFGALPVTQFNLTVDKEDFVIAADGGLNTTDKFNIKPHIILGDFDSLGSVPTGSNIITYPTEKDDTDTMLAVKYALENGYKNLHIFGCVGGRLDHTVANIQTALFIAENGGTGVFHGEQECFTVIKNSSIYFDSLCKGNISVFAVSEKAKGVDEDNLYYSLKNAELTSNFPLGVSNKFTGKNSNISVKEGSLLIIWEDICGGYSFGG